MRIIQQNIYHLFKILLLKNVNKYILKGMRIKLNKLDIFNNMKIVIKYFLLFLIIDYLGIFNVYGTNIFRRTFHMFRRRDYDNYKKYLKPYAIRKKNFIDQSDINKLNSINIPKKKDMPWISRMNTSTYKYQDMTKEDRKLVDDIILKIKNNYEKVLGKKLYDWKTNPSNFYVYYGKNSKHDWHVDPQNIDSIYNVILCIDRKGEISPFQYKNKNKKEVTYHTQPGDAILFRGGTTVHRVPPNNDPKSVRKVFSVSFSDKEEGLNLYDGNNLCTYINGGNNYFNLFKITISGFLLSYILSYISGVKKLSKNFLMIFVALVLLIAKFQPRFIDLGIGTGRSSSFFYNIFFLILTALVSLNLKRGIMFGLYFIISDLILPRKYVFYY